MGDIKTLEEETQRTIYSSKGEITDSDLYNKDFYEACKELNISEKSFINDIVRPIRDNYKKRIEVLQHQVRNYFIEFGNDPEPTPQKVFEVFFNQSDELGLSEGGFQKIIILPAYKSIDWKIISESKEKIKAVEEKFSTSPDDGSTSKAKDYLESQFEEILKEKIIPGRSLRNLLERARLLGIDVSMVSKTLVDKIRALNFEAFPELTYAEESEEQTLTSRNWYSKKEKKKLDKSPLNYLKWTLPLLATVFIIFIILGFIISFQKNDKENCSSCNLNFSLNNSILLISFYLISIAILIFLFALPHYSKRLKKPPLYLWFLYFLVGLSGVLISIFFGFHTDKLTKYDSDRHNGDYYWFNPINLLKFPLEQLQLKKNKSADIVVDNLTINHPNRIKEHSLHLIIVDRTLSGDPDSSFRNLSANQINKIGKYLKEIDSTNSTYSKDIQLRDYLAAAICHRIGEKSLNNAVDYEGTFIYRGNSKLMHVGSKIINPMSNYASNQTFAIDYFDSISTIETQKSNDQRTDFTEIFRTLFEQIKDQPVCKTNNKITQLYLYVISDFLHEEQTNVKGKNRVNFFQVEKAVSDFINKCGWKGIQVNLYQLPTFTKSKEQLEDVNKTLKIFDKYFDRSYLHNFDVELSVSENLNLLDPSNFVPFDSCDCPSIRFYYSDKDKESIAESNFRFCLNPNPQFKDTLTLQLSKDELSQHSEDFIFDYNVDTNGKNGYSSSANVNEGIQLNDVTNCTKFKMKFNDKHIPGIITPMYLDIYSQKQNLKCRRIVEFCELLPETTNYYLLILYSIFTFSLFLTSIYALHFFILRMSSKSSDVVNFYNYFFVFGSIFLLIFLIEIWSFWQYLALYEIDGKLKIIIAFILLMLTLITYRQYRYYFSKYLFIQNEGMFNKLKDGLKLSRIYLRRNRLLQKIKIDPNSFIFYK